MSRKQTKIPFNKPFIVGKELYYIAEAVTKAHLSGDGPFTQRCHKWLEQRLGSLKAFLTHSGTAALEMAAFLCDIKPGDEVILPSFTFVSTANAFVIRGATPVFVDISPETLNIDAALIEAAVTDRTKVIVPVHYAGVGCAMDQIKEIAAKHGLLIVEDAAQALFSRYKEQFLGTVGHLGCVSFHETKNVISGEGGALLVNEPQLIERAEVVWEKGTDRKKFFREEVDKYTWQDIGSSFLPSELTAAFLYAQLEQVEEIIATRRRIFERYQSLLESLHGEGCIRLPSTRSHNGHLFYILTRCESERSRLIEYLKNQDIGAVFHYVPLHSSPAGRKYGRVSGNLPVTKDLSERLLRLPLYYEMSDEDVDRVADAVIGFYSEA